MMQAMMAASRRRVTLDPDALDYFSRAEALGGSFDQTAIDPTYGEAYVKGAISDMIAGLKADAVWGKITELYLLAGVSFGGLMAKVKHAGTAVLMNNGPFVAADYVAAGTGASLKSATITDGKYLTTNYSKSGSLSNVFGGVYLQKLTTAGRTMLGAGSDLQIFNSLKYCRVGDGSLDRIGVLTGPTTVWRAGGAKFIAERTATASFSTVNPTATGTELSLFSNFDGGSDGDAEISAAWTGSSALSTADALAIHLRINALMTALGCNVYNNP